MISRAIPGCPILPALHLTSTSAKGTHLVMKQLLRRDASADRSLPLSGALDAGHYEWLWQVSDDGSVLG